MGQGRRRGSDTVSKYEINFFIKSGEIIMAKATGKNPTVLQMDIIDLWTQGQSNEEIALRLNCSVQTVKDTKKIDSLKQIFYERQNAQIEELLPLAIKRLTTLIKDDKQMGTVHIAAVREVLDRSHLKELMDNSNKDIKITVTYE